MSMEPVSKLLGKLKFPEETVSAEELVRAAWGAAVGERIAGHARAERLVRDKLIVGVDDVVWRKNLFTMSKLILAGIARQIGEGVVTELEFRVAPARRGPQRAERSTGASADEADRIEDPGLRRIYIASRKKETA
jgi:predicted nucleic acid-binding Zn ribbon protein